MLARLKVGACKIWISRAACKATRGSVGWIETNLNGVDPFKGWNREKSSCCIAKPLSIVFLCSSMYRLSAAFFLEHLLPLLHDLLLHSLQALGCKMLVHQACQLHSLHLL